MMISPPSPLKIDAIAARFALLLREAGTSPETPALRETWRAFAAFGREAVQCEDERLFFEADLSASTPDSFYVHFSRTIYGREPKGYVWSHEVICDFLFPLTEELEEFNFSVEAEDLVFGSPERNEFFARIEANTALWAILSAAQPVTAAVYIGES